jgi:hypothetical protein
MKTSARLFGLTLCLFCFMALQAWAGELLDTELNEFTSNTQALAVEVNENFDAVQTEINDNDSRITTMESGKQNRVDHECSSGYSIRAINADGTVDCEYDSIGSGDITAVTAGTGLTGGGSSGGVTLNADTTYLQRRVGSCPSGYAIQSIAQDGTVTCEYDNYYTGDITAVYAGTGLSGGATSGSATLSANTSYLQRRVTSTCGSYQAMYQINSDGTAYCQSVGDVTAVYAGSNVTGGGYSGGVTISVPGMPGFEHNYTSWGSVSSTASTILSASISPPANGYVIAIYNSSIKTYHTNGKYRTIHYALTDNASLDPSGYSSHYSYKFYYYHTSLPTGAYGGTAATTAYFSCTSGVTKTIYLRAKYTGDETTYCYMDYNPNILLIFVPNRY